MDRGIDEARRVRLVREALELDPAARSAYLDAECGDDPELRRSVQRLLDEAIALESTTPTVVHGEVDVPCIDLPDPMLGARLGPFRLRERIGRGGMGVVYRAEREEGGFAQTVAIKLIRRGFDFDEMQHRFLRERRILARLSHPNLARLIDGGVTGELRPWFAMEYVQGRTIRDWCDERRLDVRARVRLFLDVCAAVQYAHTQLVLHRDLKPGNVMVDEQGVVRLLDFGISRLLHDDSEADNTLTVAGPGMAFTPEYAAPEQLAGEPAGVAADVYALGVILYELITGVLPHEVSRHDLVAAQHRLRTQPVPSLATAIQRTTGNGSRPDHAAVVAQRLAARGQPLRAYLAAVRGDLNRILAKALAVDPEERYPTVESFADDLRRWLAGAPVRASGRRWTYRLRKFVARNAAAVTVAIVLLLGLLVSLAWALERAHRERQQRELAQVELRRSNAVRDYIALMFRTAAEAQTGGEISARDVLARSSERLFSQFRNDPETGRVTALMVAELYLAMGDVDGAEPLLQRIIATAGDGADDHVARAHRQLAELEYRRGRLEQALHQIDAAQAIWRADPKRNALALGGSENLRAQVLRGLGRLGEALEVQSAAIGERQRVLLEPDEDLADAYNNLAIILMAAFRFDEAMVMSDHALEIQRQLGAEHSVQAIAVLGTRASILTAQGRHAEAEGTYRTLIDLRSRLYGDSSLDLALLLGSLGTSILYQQRHAEAAEVLERAVAMAVRHDGGTHPSIMTLRMSLAGSYARMGRGEDALAVLAAVQEWLDTQGDNPSLRAMLHTGRSRALLSMGHLRAARAALAEAEATYAAMGVSGEQFNAWLESLRSDLEAAERQQASR